MSDNIIYGETGPTGPMGPKGPEGIIIKGNTGAKGERGPKGEIGETGPTGQQGDKGQCVAGEPGLMGPPGEKGLTGEEGYIGVNFPGFIGPPGPEGPQGETGSGGIQGIQGNAGDIGDPGPQGPAGPKGDQGIQGIQGEVGEKGPSGEKGHSGQKGVQGVQGDIGPVGQRGEKGTTGETGDPGTKGIMGSTGLAGDRGPTGIKGNKGFSMTFGPVGFQGNKGEVGDKGFQGATGETGTKGIMGFQGQKGEKGIQGTVQGDKGDQGDTGETGPQGYNGDRGEQGEKGIQGFTGPTGEIGMRGPTGPLSVADGWIRPVAENANIITNNSTKYSSVGLFKNPDTSKYSLDISGTMNVTGAITLDGATTDYLSVIHPKVVSMFQVYYMNDDNQTMTPSNPIAANKPIFKLVVGNAYNLQYTRTTDYQYEKFRQAGYTPTHPIIGLSGYGSVYFSWMNGTTIQRITAAYLGLLAKRFFICPVKHNTDPTQKKLVMINFSTLGGRYPKNNDVTNFDDNAQNDASQYMGCPPIQNGELTYVGTSASYTIQQLPSYPEGDTQTNFICMDERYGTGTAFNDRLLNTPNKDFDPSYSSINIVNGKPEYRITSLTNFSRNFTNYRPDVDFYCAGNYSNPQYFAKYNPSTNVWSPVTADNGTQINGPITGMIVCRYSRKIFISGSFTSTGGPSAITTKGNLCLDVANNHWISMGSPSGSLPCNFTYMQLNNTEKGYPTAGSDKDKTAQEWLGAAATKIYMCGPGDANGDNKVAIYNVTSGQGSWTLCGKKSPNGEVKCCAMDSYNNYLFVGGAFTQVYNTDESGNVIETIDSPCVAYFDLNTSKWKACGKGLTHTTVSVTPEVRFMVFNRVVTGTVTFYVLNLVGKFNKDLLRPSTITTNQTINNFATYDVGNNMFLYNQAKTYLAYFNPTVDTTISRLGLDTSYCFINQNTLLDVNDVTRPFYSRNEEGLYSSSFIDSFTNPMYEYCTGNTIINQNMFKPYFQNYSTLSGVLNGALAYENVTSGKLSLYVYTNGAWTKTQI